MKKAIIRIVAILLFFFLIASVAIADNDNTYYIKEINLTVTVPKGFIAFTREIKADDPNLEKYGLTKDLLLSVMKEQHTYIEILSNDGFTEMYVTMMENSRITDFSHQSDSELKKTINETLPQYTQMGISVTKYEIYKHAQTKFIKLYATHTVNGSTVYTRQYSTVYDGSTYNFTMQSYSGEISDTQENAILSFVDSAVFGRIAPYAYTDSKTGLKFVVPANWTEEPLSKQRNTIDVKFVSEGSNFAEIMYGSIDMWSEMSESDKAGMDRSNVNNSFFSLEDIKNIMTEDNANGSDSSPISDVKKVTYGNIEYYCIETSMKTFGITIPRIILMHIDNGYIYLFQFYGESNSKNYMDFESLLKDADYPKQQTRASESVVSNHTYKPTVEPKTTNKPMANANKTPSIGSDYSSDISSDRKSNNTEIKWATIIGIAIWALIPSFIAKKKGRSFFGYYFLSFLITPLATTIITICQKDRNKVNEGNPVNSDTKIEQDRQQIELEENNSGEIDEDMKESVKNNYVGISEIATDNYTKETTVESKNENHDDRIKIDTMDSIASGMQKPEIEKETVLRFCRYCGFKLLENSEYCSQCGKKVQ